jgi:hypothetical protein
MRRADDDFEREVLLETARGAGVLRVVDFPVVGWTTATVPVFALGEAAEAEASEAMLEEASSASAQSNEPHVRSAITRREAWCFMVKSLSNSYGLGGICSLLFPRKGGF